MGKRSVCVFVGEQALAELLSAREEDIASVVNGLCGSIAAILQQRCSKVPGNWTRASYSARIVSELQELKKQQESQLKSKADSQADLLRTSLQASYDAVVRHSKVLADREKSALAKLNKALKKEIRAAYAAAAAKASAATEAQAEALEFAARKCKEGSSTANSVSELLLACFADLDGSAGQSDRNSPYSMDPGGVEAARSRTLEMLEASISTREEAQKQRQVIRLEHLQQHHQAVLKLLDELSRLTVSLAVLA